MKSEKVTMMNIRTNHPWSKLANLHLSPWKPADVRSFASKLNSDATE